MPEQVIDKEAYMKQVPARAIEPIAGTLVHYEQFPSERVRSRPVDVWLPEGYDATSATRYPVIYMHDGQFLFHVKTSPMAGMDLFWEVDKCVSRLAQAAQIAPPIVVSVWMADWLEGARGAEYMPQKPVTEYVWQAMLRNSWNQKEGSEPLNSENYLRFLVEELKPFVDTNYATKPDREATFIMGSSMGGLISAYALTEYPDVYGGAACMSTHWNIAGDEAADDAIVNWFDDHWPEAGRHRVYFDRGTESYDASYGPYQEKMDGVMRRHGFSEDVDWTTQCFVGADHSSQAWRERLHVPLKFLLGAL